MTPLLVLLQDKIEGKTLRRKRPSVQLNWRDDDLTANTPLGKAGVCLTLLCQIICTHEHTHSTGPRKQKKSGICEFQRGALHVLADVSVSTNRQMSTR